MSVPLTIALGTLTVLSGYWDVRWRTIPNWLTVGGLAAGLALGGMLGGWVGLRDAASGMGLALLIHLPLFALRMTSGGDVKLMAAIGALAGPSLFLQIFVVSAILGGLYALVAVATGRRVLRTLKNLALLMRELVSLKPPHRSSSELDVTHEASRRVPRGLMVLIATVAILAAR